MGGLPALSGTWRRAVLGRFKGFISESECHCQHSVYNLKRSVWKSGHKIVWVKERQGLGIAIQQKGMR
jgi:hypothetical protein